MSTVTISKSTMMVLKNFSTINGSIVIRQGSTIKTINVGENLVAEYECEEAFPQTFAIYDLNQFLAGVSLFDRPSLVFGNGEYLTIKGNGRNAKYYFSDPEITLKTAPDRKVNFPGADIEFTIKEKDLENLRKASDVYGIPDLVFKSDDQGIITLNLCDRENETSNVYTQEVKGETTGEYELSMKMENIRLLPGEYEVKISSKLITQWKNTSLNLTYWIALEP
jgi:hypothetical protein